MNRLAPRIERLLAVRADPRDSAELRLRKRLFMGTVTVGIGVVLVNAVLALLNGQSLVSGILITLAMIMAGTLVAFRRGRLAFETAATLVPVAALVQTTLVAASFGGIRYSDGEVLWGVIAPVGSLVLVPRMAWRLLAAYIGSILLLLLIEPYLTVVTMPSPLIDNIFYASNIIGPVVFVFVVTRYFMQQRSRAFALLHEEQAKSEQLLLNILPAPIAAILKDSPQTIADQFEEVSILFADVVDFTPLSARLSPVELVSLLNEVFSHFDQLADYYGLEKIKTIGDCYMAAAGVPAGRADHAAVLAQMALDMRDYVNTHTFAGGRQLQMRIGLNSGPVVAGVIGTKKFIYDLWGDTVNIASRMESHGHGGQISLTRATYERIKDVFLCEARGRVPVKGKGEMEIWTLVGRRPQLT